MQSAEEVLEFAFGCEELQTTPDDHNLSQFPSQTVDSENNACGEGSISTFSVPFHTAGLDKHNYEAD